MAGKGHRPAGLQETLPGLRKVLWRLRPYLGNNRALLLGGGASLLAATAMKLAEPWPLKFVIDRVVPGALAGQPQAMPLEQLLALCAAGLLVAVGLRALFDYLATLSFALAGNRVLAAVRADLFAHLQRLSMAFHTRSRPGDITMRLISDVGMLRETAVTAAMPLVANILVLVAMIGVMVWLDWRLALVAIAPLPLLWLLTASMGKRIQTASRAQRKREGAMAATASEALSGMQTIQALGLEGQTSKTFGMANARSMSEGARATRLSAGLERSVDLLVGAATAFVLWFGTLSVIDGRILPGDLLVFITYMKNTFRPVRDYAKYTARLSKATAAGERVIELLDTDPGLPEGTTEARDLRGDVDFDAVRFSHPGRPVLEDLTLSIPAGQVVALTGPSGAGKSTIAGLVLRLQDPEAGAVRFDGQDLRDFTLASLRGHISFVPQEPLLFRATVAENIVMGAGREVTPAEVEAAARRANAQDFIAAMPEGYGTLIEERGRNLSAGQRQRLAIARASLRRAPILLLDEPTVGLDSASETAVRAAILKLAEGRTTLMITHDLSLAARADRVIFLQGGSIAEDGSHEALIARGGGYARLWQLQRGGRDGGASRAAV